MVYEGNVDILDRNTERRYSISSGTSSGPHVIGILDKKAAKQIQQRQRFMANLIKAGLDMEEVSKALLLVSLFPNFCFVLFLKQKK